MRVLQYCAGGQCRNTPGSFTCVCAAGTRYEADEQVCRDVDECEGELLSFATAEYDRGDIPPARPRAGYRLPTDTACAHIRPPSML